MAANARAGAAENCRRAVELLREARDLLVQAGAAKAANKVRLAITSTGGAIRHAEGKAIRPPFNMED